MDAEQDFYWTPGDVGESELKVKGSRFIGFACAVQSREEAETHIRKIRKKYHDATHHCYAYRIGLDNQAFRASDDGEPSGTAGKPILDAMDGCGLTFVLCVVTRYFGGTKLGTGGLARAYGKCAAETLNAAKRVQKFIHVAFLLSFPYALTGTVMPLLSLNDCRIVETRYGEGTEMTIHVRQSLAEGLVRQLQEATSGKIIVCPAATGGGH